MRQGDKVAMALAKQSEMTPQERGLNNLSVCVIWMTEFLNKVLCFYYPEIDRRRLFLRIKMSPPNG